MAASIQRSYYGFTAIYQRENKTFNFEITPFIIFSFVFNHYSLMMIIIGFKK